MEVSKIAERSFLIKVLVFEIPVNQSRYIVEPLYSVDAYDLDSFNGWVCINILAFICAYIYRMHGFSCTYAITYIHVCTCLRLYACTLVVITHASAKTCKLNPIIFFSGTNVLSSYMGETEQRRFGMEVRRNRCRAVSAAWMDCRGSRETE